MAKQRNVIPRETSNERAQRLVHKGKCVPPSGYCNASADSTCALCGEYICPTHRVKYKTGYKHKGSCPELGKAISPQQLQETESRLRELLKKYLER